MIPPGKLWWLGRAEGRTAVGVLAQQAGRVEPADVLEERHLLPQNTMAWPKSVDAIKQAKYIRRKRRQSRRFTVIRRPRSGLLSRN